MAKRQSNDQPVISFRVNQAEFSALQTQAKAQNLSVHQYARYRTLGTTDSPNTNYYAATNSRLNSVEQELNAVKAAIKHFKKEG